MLKQEHDEERELSSEARIFAQKIARSIIEIEPNVNNTADVVVLLEVLGYSKDQVVKYGFKDFFDFANYIYDFLDAYEDRDKSKDDYVKTFSLPIDGLNKRIAEGLGLIFPWLGTLLLLFLTGISLWMSWGLPLQVSTALVVGVFLGLVLSEGLLQIFGKPFTFYYEQANIGEMKRLLKRNYLTTFAILGGVVLCLYSYGLYFHVPFELVSISCIATITITLHRTSYMVIFVLKKITHLIFAYSGAFVAILSVYFLLAPLIHESVFRYFVALGAAFAILSIFALYHNLKTISINPSLDISAETPHFYKPRTQTDKTLRANFGVQVWESIPNFLFSTFYFIMMFSDRIISWSVNQLKVNGIMLPLGFNAVYHVGADLALAILVPGSVLQYVMAAPIFKQINNLSVTHKISETDNIAQFIQKTYRKIFLVSLLASVITALFINLVVAQPSIYHVASQESIPILRIASIGNVLLSLFSANTVFLILLNRIKPLAVISMICAAVVSVGGILVGRYGLENITIFYLISAALASASSTFYIKKIFSNAPSIFFARYV